jgi:hypothetical protein
MDFYVWATLTTDLSADRLVSGLVRKGYTTGPLAASGELSWSGELSSLVALKLTPVKDPAKDPALSVMKDVVKVLEELKATRHSLIVLHVGGTCTWRGSNIVLPKELAKTVHERLIDDVDELDGEKK